MKIHSSKLARVMSCAGSLFFKNLPHNPPDEKRKEGTAAGEYLELLLTGQPIGTHAKNGVPFDGDMKFYAEEVAEEIKAKATSKVLCETKTSWTTRSGIEIAGKYDASFIVDSDTLYIDDYKYGYSLVEVENNWQLSAYAIGEIIRLDKAFKKIVLRIHQPRPHHEDGPTREWVIDYAKVIELKEVIETRMDAIAAGEKTLQTGPQCKYCEAASSCPAFNKAYHRGVEIAHEFLQDDIDDHELSFQLDLLDRVEDLLKTRRDSINQLAVHRIKTGKLIPNYITKESYSNRSWKPGITPELILMMTGKEIVEKKILTPAKAEKLGVPKELTADMTQRMFIGQKLTRCDTTKMGDQIFGKPRP